MRRHIVGCLIALLFTGTVHAGILINLDEVGSDVVASSSGGSLDLSAASLWIPSLGPQNPVLNPASGVLLIGSFAKVDLYNINTGPEVGSIIGAFFPNTSSGTQYVLGSKSVLNNAAGYACVDTQGASSAKCPHNV